MILTYFTENMPFAVTEFPFDDMYITDAKFVKIAKQDELWLGILIGDYTKYLGDTVINPVTTLDGFTNIQTSIQVTKSEIVNRMFTYDEQIKILRDKQMERNLELFNEFDTFVQSIP
jgi:hypothetical protein